MTEYSQAVGKMPSDPELKSDLLSILPSQIRETLLWHSCDVGVNYSQFRDTVITQTAKMLLERGNRRSVSAVDQEQSDRDALMKLINGEGGEAEASNSATLEELSAAVRQQRKRPN